MQVRLIVWIAVVASVASSAFAQFSYVTQTRTISARTAGSSSTTTLSAINFETFNESVTSPGTSGTSTASQNSNLGELQITASGQARPGGGPFGGVGIASSSFSVTFRCPVDQQFTLSGTSLSALGQLNGPGVFISITQGASANGVFRANQTYTLSISTTGVGPNQTASFSYTLTLTGTVPQPQTPAFTYQGILRDADGNPVNGTFDFEYKLFPASLGQFQVGPTLTFANVDVVDGLFSSVLDFGAVLQGSQRWLEISARHTGSSDPFEALPRARIEAAPYAAYALQAPWSGISGIPSTVTNPFWTALPSEEGITAVGTVRIQPPAIPANPDAHALEVVGSARFNQGIFFGDYTENGDLIGFQRVNGTPGSNELRLIVGSAAPVDFFTIGTVGFNPVFGFRMDGLASKPGGGDWAVLSDPSTKHDITPLVGTLDRLLTLRGYQYVYNDDVVKAGKALPGPQIGLMADEVQRLFPGWVDRGSDGLLVVTERSTTALMVEALRDLRMEKDAQITELRRQLDEARARNESIEARLRALEEHAADR